MLKVLYCDDESNFISSFAKKHGPPEFEVITTNDICSVPATLNEMTILPDLVVLDLYHTKTSPDTDEAKLANEEVERKLQAVKTAMDSLREVVGRSKEPAAIKVLEQIRSYDKLKEIPVLLYTREGLSLLNDDDLRKSLQLGADWMLKGRSKEFESGKMYGFIQQRKSQNLGPDIGKLTIGQLLRELTPAQLWKILVALVTALVGVATFAYWLGQKFG